MRLVFQLGTPWADGTASISQCPISPEETFVYRFKVDRVSFPTSSHPFAAEFLA